MLNTFPRPKPKPTKTTRTKRRKASKPLRKVLEAQLEAIVKLIVFWRDGSQCVEGEIDGGRCGNVMQWGHFVPRSRSKFLKYDLATFVQCNNHNLIHDSRKTGGGDPVFGLWFVKKFGVTALEMLHQTQRENSDGSNRTIPELEEMLAHYEKLYQNRFYVSLDTHSLIAAGYYGDIIREAWVKEGRI